MDHFQILEQYHHTPGQTQRALNGWVDAANQTSYEVLAARIAAFPRNATVLDLGCGDGPMLKILWELGFRNLIGLDQSGAELEAARKQLDPRIRLCHEKAQKLSLPDDSLDLVICHMSMATFKPLEQILTNLGRVLKCGGRLVAVTNRAKRDPAYQLFKEEMLRVYREEKIDPLRLGDARVYSQAGWVDLLTKTSFSTGTIEFVDDSLSYEAAPPEIWASLELMYDVFQLPSPAKARLRDRVLAGWTGLVDLRGNLTCRVGMRLVSCRA